MYLPEANEVDGTRLASLRREEMVSLLKMRVETYLKSEQEGALCPENMKPHVRDITEVLNALSQYRQHHGYRDSFQLAMTLVKINR